ncbi:MAG: hypothetical protein ABI835_02835 [Chloroflexota bacterium]
MDYAELRMTIHNGYEETARWQNYSDTQAEALFDLRSADILANASGQGWIIRGVYSLSASYGKEIIVILLQRDHGFTLGFGAMQVAIESWNGTPAEIQESHSGSDPSKP